MKFELLNTNVRNRDNFVKNWAVDIKSDSLVLDVGAGTGPYRHYFSHTKYFTHDATPLRKDQLRNNKKYTEIDYVSDILNLPIENASFDAIICTEVLEHVPDPYAAIQEMSRILKPGGKILITAPLGSGLHQVPYHFYGGFTPYFYTYAMEKYFSDLTINPNGSSFLFFYQECLRCAKMNLKSKFIFITFPLSFLLILVSLFISLYDKLKLYIPNYDFVVGYHVTAIKK